MNFNPQSNVRFVKKLLCGASLGALATVIAGASPWRKARQRKR